MTFIMAPGARPPAFWPGQFVIGSQVAGRSWLRRGWQRGGRVWFDRAPRVSYSPAWAGADRGRQELVSVLMALIAWGDRWATPEGGPPDAVPAPPLRAAVSPPQSAAAPAASPSAPV